MAIPTPIEPNLTAAVATFNGSRTVENLRVCEQYRSTQYAANYTANQGAVRTLEDQLEAAKHVSARLLALANQHGTAAVAAIAADGDAAVAWRNTRSATIAASVQSQIESVTASVP